MSKYDTLSDALCGRTKDLAGTATDQQFNDRELIELASRSHYGSLRDLIGTATNNGAPEDQPDHRTS